MNKKNWDDIRFVLAVARAGSLNAAAAKLGVTHATVMRRVAAFESSFGQQVFEKSPSGYKIRPEARPVLRSMESVEDAIVAVERSVAGADKSLAGLVRIASTDSLCNLVLPAVVSKISAKHPNIQLTVLSANSHHDLTRLTADIVVRATNSLDDTMTGQSIGTLKFAAFHDGSPNQKWLNLEGALARSVPAQWLRDHVPQEQVTGGADSFLALQQLAAQGAGKALLPEFVGDAEDRLTRVTGEMPLKGVKIWVATLREFAHVPRFVSVQDMLVKELRASPILRP